MTEQEWLASDNPRAMLQGMPTRASDHKLRLWACACVRQQVWQQLTDPRSREAVEIAERYADGTATGRELLIARDAARNAYYEAAQSSTDNALLSAGWFASMVASAQSEWARHWIGSVASVTARPDLLRDIVGNPWRPVTINPAWRTPLVMDLARTAYEKRPLEYGPLDRDRLLILADALEEAGCDNAEILGHLRRPLHCPGCGGSGTIKQPAHRTVSYLMNEPYYFVDTKPQHIIDIDVDPSHPSQELVYPWPSVGTPCPMCKLLNHGPHVRGCWVLDLLLGRG